MRGRRRGEDKGRVNGREKIGEVRKMRGEEEREEERREGRKGKGREREGRAEEKRGRGRSICNQLRTFST